VYRDSIDNIIGILHIKDLLTMATVGTEKPFSLESMIREPFIVPESKTIDETFHEMQTKHEQIAVVIDEYGGTAGIITIEDLLEEIVGNMQDEYDEEDEEIVRQDENTLIVDGMTSLDEISDALDIQLPQDRDYDTIAGMVIDLLGRIPDEEEHPEITYQRMIFAVMEMQEKRISKIKITMIRSMDHSREQSGAET
jgi:putative hemolysin